MMAGKSKKGLRKLCREELIVLQGVPPSEIAKQKTKREKGAEKEKLEEMARAAEAKAGASGAVVNCAVGKGKTSRVSKKSRKSRAVEMKIAKEEAGDGDSSESRDVNEIEWNSDSDFEEDGITAKDKLTDEGQVCRKEKDQGHQVHKERRIYRLDNCQQEARYLQEHQEGGQKEKGGRGQGLTARETEGGRRRPGGKR